MKTQFTVVLPLGYWTYRIYATISILPALLTFYLAWIPPPKDSIVAVLNMGLLITCLGILAFNLYLISAFDHGYIPSIIHNYITENTPAPLIHRFLRSLILYEMSLIWFMLIPLGYHPLHLPLMFLSTGSWLYGYHTMPGRLIKPPTSTHESTQKPL